MRRQKSRLVMERNQPILEEIRSLKAEHPLWGYRRVWSYLKYRQGLSVNKKRIYRLMKEQGFMVTKNFRLKAKRTKMRPKPRADMPNQYWGMDMTKIRMRTWGWLYLVIVLDWYTKEIIGYSLGLQSKTEDWLWALNRAVNNRFPSGIRESEKEQIHLINDNGCQPTSERFMKACSTLGIKQIFTSWCNPKGNSDTERIMRTIKEDAVWPYEWDDPFEFEDHLNRWIDRYNRDFPHQSLNNQTPHERYVTFHVKEQPKNEVPVLTKNSLA